MIRSCINLPSDHQDMLQSLVDPRASPTVINLEETSGEASPLDLKITDLIEVNPDDNDEGSILQNSDCKAHYLKVLEASK